jgi:hypothetical protein
MREEQSEEIFQATKLTWSASALSMKGMRP